MNGSATTLRSIFFDSPADARAALVAALESGGDAEEVRGALGQTPEAARTAVLKEVARAAEEILELDVTDIFEQAWRRTAALRAAATTTLTEPDSEQIVALAAHTMSLDHIPQIEVQVDDNPVATITLGVRLEMMVRGLVVAVRGGLLTAVLAGSCDITGTLTVAGLQVWQGAVSLELPPALRPGSGIPLRPDAVEA